VEDQEKLSHLTEDQSIPESMFYLPSCVKVSKLGLQGLVKQCALDARNVSANHGGLVNSVQNARDGREEVRLQNLGVLKEAQRVPSVITDPSTNGDTAQFANSLE
jgi:hypothetical protein